MDNSPAAAIYFGYLPATVKPFFGNASNSPFPNGIPAFWAPADQPDVPVKTTVLPILFQRGADPSQRAGGRHEPFDGAIGMC